MGDDDDNYSQTLEDWDWPDLTVDSECGEHCVILTLHTRTGTGRSIERHCDCQWCHGTEE